MYAKMQYTHVLVSQIRGDKYRKLAAREELWRGQCHSAYWHGRHGGIYCNRLRKHVYRSLIEAEKRTREKGVFIPSIVTVDFDMDGLTEHLFQGQEINAYVHKEGGVLFELDYLPVSWNYLDTLSRRAEGYHDEAAAQNGYDQCLRKTFVDHFISHSEAIDAFETGSYTELGEFVTGLYEPVSHKRDSRKLELSASGTVRQTDGAVPVQLQKTFSFKRNAVEVSYAITNSGDASLSAVFAPEINVALLSDAPEASRCFVCGTDQPEREIALTTAAHSNVSEVRLDDLTNDVRITISGSDPREYWVTAVKTVALCDDELRTTYQSTAIVPRVPLDLNAGETTELGFTVRLERL